MKIYKVPVGLRLAKLEDVFSRDWNLIRHNSVFVRIRGEFVNVETFSGHEKVIVWLQAFYCEMLYVLTTAGEIPDVQIRLCVVKADITDLFMGYHPKVNTIYFRQLSEFVIDGPLRIRPGADYDETEELLKAGSLFTIYRKQLFEVAVAKAS